MDKKTNIFKDATICAMTWLNRGLRYDRNKLYLDKKEISMKKFSNAFLDKLLETEDIRITNCETARAYYAASKQDKEGRSIRKLHKKALYDHYKFDLSKGGGYVDFNHYYAGKEDVRDVYVYNATGECFEGTLKMEILLYPHEITMSQFPLSFHVGGHNLEKITDVTDFKNRCEALYKVGTNIADIGISALREAGDISEDDFYILYKAYVNTYGLGQDEELEKMLSEIFKCNSLIKYFESLEEKRKELFFNLLYPFCHDPKKEFVDDITSDFNTWYEVNGRDRESGSMNHTLFATQKEDFDYIGIKAVTTVDSERVTDSIVKFLAESMDRKK